MAKKLIDTEKDVEIDVRKTENFKNVNKQAFDAVFDNSHSTKKLESVFDEIETQTLPGFCDGEFKEVELTPKKQTEQNPFFGDKNALKNMKKHSFKEVVSTPEEPAPTLEIKQEIKVSSNLKAQPQTKRKKLWMITGIICVVLFLGIFGYNMISINSLAKKIAKMEHQIQEQEQVVDGEDQNAQQQIDDLLNQP